MSTQKKKQSKRWKRIVKRIIILVIVLAIAAIGVLIGLDTLRAKYTVTYDSYNATIGSINNSLSFSGSLALIDSETHTASGSATVRTIYAPAGSSVKKGDKLMRLSNGETIKADMDGTVNVVGPEVNDEVAAGDTLVQIADFTNLQISIRVDEYDISSVHVGDEVTVTTTATEQVFPSIIRSINYISASTGNVAYYSANLRVTVTDGIYPGMQVTVTIPQESAENVVVLKADALSFDEKNSAYVYMYNEENELVPINVEVGVSNGNYVEIKSGVKDGDTVYVESKATLPSGIASMMNGMFGSTRINQRGNYQRQNYGENRSNSNNGNYPGGNMPGGSNGGR